MDFGFWVCDCHRGRVVAGRRNYADHAEGHRIERGHPRISAARQRDQRIAPVDHARRLADGVGAGGAGRHGRGGRAVQSEAHG